MENQLDIYIPQLEDLRFRQKMLADKRTMDYNIGFEPYDGYNPLDGTIEFPHQMWKRWHDGWTDKRNRCFYAYIVRKSDGVWVGDIAYHYRKNEDKPVIHIVIDAEFRGKGYSKEALILLCQAAKKNGVKRIYNDIPHNRIGAIKTHKAVGFKEVKNRGEYCYLVLDL